MISIQYFNSLLSPIPSDLHYVITFSPDSDDNAYVFVNTSSILSSKFAIKFLNHLNPLHSQTIIKFINIESQIGLRGVLGFEETRNEVKEDLRVWKPRKLVTREV
jgi:hypothetical protein